MLTRIRVSFGRTVNTGNFNSFKVEAGMEVDVEPIDDVNPEYAKALDQVKAIVAAEVTKSAGRLAI